MEGWVTFTLTSSNEEETVHWKRIMGFRYTRKSDDSCSICVEEGQVNGPYRYIKQSYDEMVLRYTNAQNSEREAEMDRMKQQHLDAAAFGDAISAAQVEKIREEEKANRDKFMAQSAVNKHFKKGS